jgi:hypothetical protein
MQWGKKKMLCSKVEIFLGRGKMISVLSKQLFLRALLFSITSIVAGSVQIKMALAAEGDSRIYILGSRGSLAGFLTISFPLGAGKS